MEFANEVAKIGKRKFGSLKFTLLVREDEDKYTHFYSGNKDDFDDFVIDFLAHRKTSTAVSMHGQDHVAYNDKHYFSKLFERAQTSGTVNNDSDTTVVQSTHQSLAHSVTNRRSRDHVPDIASGSASGSGHRLASDTAGDVRERDVSRASSSPHSQQKSIHNKWKRKYSSSVRARSPKKDQGKKINRARGMGTVDGAKKRRNPIATSELKYFAFEDRPMCHICGSHSKTDQRTYDHMTYYRWYCVRNGCRKTLGLSSKENLARWKAKFFIF